MNTRLTVLAAILLLCQQPLRADWIIKQKTTTAGQEKEMVTKIKGDKIRSDTSDDMTVMMDSSTGSVATYMHKQKAVMRLDGAALKGMMAMAAQMAGGGSGKVAEPKATGEKAKVGEWDTEVYAWDGKIGSGKFYVAKDFPKFKELSKAQDDMTKALGNPMSGLMPSMSSFPGMVVKSEMKAMGQTVTTELISAKEEEVSEDEFKAPEGYSEMKLPAIPGLNKVK